MVETGQELANGTCCLCLSEDETTFHTNSIMKSLPLHEMVDFCIGIQVRIRVFFLIHYNKEELFIIMKRKLFHYSHLF